MFELIKNLSKKIFIYYNTKKYHIPNNCDIHYRARAKGSIFEGFNRLGKDSFLIDSIIGYGSYLGTNCLFSNCIIGRYCSIASNVKVISGRHPTKDFVSTYPAFYSTSDYLKFTYTKSQLYQEYKLSDKRHNVVIGNDVWIGSDALILGGINIGDGAVVGAGAVVTKDVPPYAIVVGVPAKAIRYRFNESDINFLLTLKWWNNSEQWIMRAAPYFAAIEKLREFVKSGGSELDR